MKVKYEGPSPSRAVPQLGIRAVERGESIEVAADVGRELVKQAGWVAPRKRRDRDENTSGDDNTNQEG